MRLADLRAPAELLQATCDDARLVIERDPDLQSERGATCPALPVPA
jgi:ATP-dependent DNA helicase RecG